jgi:hypothetical protein
MRIGTILVAVAMTGITLPALAQRDNLEINKPLTECLEAADKKYNDTWEALCRQSGKAVRCTEFVGTAKDREFSQLRVSEMTVCIQLHK